MRGPRALAARGRRPLLSAAPLSGVPVPLSAPPHTISPPSAVSTRNSSPGAPDDRCEPADAAARPGLRARPASHRGAATQSGLHGQLSADCGHRRCARSNGQRGGEGCPAGGMPIVSPGPMWPAAVLSPSRMRVREQTELSGPGGRGAAAAARWLRPSWSLRVGFRIAVADQRVVNALTVAPTEPTGSHLPRIRHHPFPASELIWGRAESKRARQPPRYHRHRGPDHGLSAGPPRACQGLRGGPASDLKLLRAGAAGPSTTATPAQP